MIHYRPLAFITFFAVILMATPLTAQEDTQNTEDLRIQFIEVEGSQRVEAETVRSYMILRPGMTADPVLLDQSLKSMFASGLFADVTIRRERGGLVVTVVENPIINRVIFEGNDKLDDDALYEESSLRPRQVYTRSKIQNDVEKFVELYRRSGRFSAKVEPKVIQLPQNRVDVVLRLRRGKPPAFAQSISLAMKGLMMTVCVKKCRHRSHAGGASCPLMTNMTRIVLPMIATYYAGSI